MTEIRIQKQEPCRLRITSVYNPACVNRGKTISKSGWHPKGRYWAVPHSKAIVERLLSIFDEKKLDLDPALQITIQSEVKKQASNQEQNIGSVKKNLNCEDTAGRHKRHICIICPLSSARKKWDRFTIHTRTIGS